MSAPTDINGNEPISTELAVSEPKPTATTTENTDTSAAPTETTTTPATTTATTPTTNKAVQKPQKKKDNRNDPARFEGLGINFNAKLIGVDSVPDARGDKMCQEKMQQLKLAVKTSGVHKQRILVNVSEQGIKLIDQRTGVPNYQHAVNRISFISRDSTDSRAFGYVFGDVDGTHKFFAIKTEKAAENLVLTLRDLFQIVYAKKKQEMEEAKKQQQIKVEEEKKAEEEAAEKAKTVITLGGELEQESSTDDEPVYQVPTNNTPVKAEEPSAGSNLVDLENELQTLGQGIEQMNQFESLFDSMDTPETGTKSPASQSDPWGVSSSDTTKSMPKSSSAGDLADLDLFNAPVQKKKEDIMNLFGPPMPPAGPQGFGAAPFPGAPANPGFQNAWPGGTAPGTPFPVAAPVAPVAPFGGVPMAGGMPGAMPPPVPQRQMGGGMTVPSTNNPFASDPFSSQPGAPSAAAFSAFPNAAPQPAASSDASLLDQPLLPFKLENEPPPETKPASGKGAFDDLCDIGAKDKANKAPKDLFADLSAVPKKSIKEMMNTSNPPAGQPQAQASDNPFGTLDRNASLPAAFDFSSPFPSTKSTDPFDTSFVDPAKPHLPIAKVFPITKESSNEKLNLHIDNLDVKGDLKSNGENIHCDSDDFDLPSPDGPPPPLPVEKPPEPPLPKLPPRPGVGTIQDSNMKQSPFNNPKIPPRNTVTDSTKTAISPIPRPRPRPNLNKDDGLPSVPPRPVRNIDSSSGKTSQQIDANSSDKSKMEDDKPVIIDQSKSSNNNSSVHGRHFVIEDPFTTSDPFADTDPFSSSDGFSSCDFISANDPFISTFSSQSTSNQNGLSDKSLNDDPFAVFDNSLNDSFSFKNSSRKSSKAGSSSRKNSSNASDPFGGVPFIPAVPNSQEAVYATVNKPKN